MELTAAPIATRSQTLRSIEAARAVAALCVVLMHGANLMQPAQLSGRTGLGGIFDFGYVGVDFFFVLSGFIITWVHVDALGSGVSSIGDYLWRRFTRIYPIYWTILLMSIAISVLARVATHRTPLFDVGPGDFASTFLLWIGAAGEPKYVGVAWSLKYEVMFYLLFCSLLLSRRWGALFLTAWAVAIVGEGVGLWAPWLPTGMASFQCLEFLGGIALALWIHKRGAQASRFQLVLVALALVAAVIFETHGPFPPHGNAGRMALGLASAALLYVLVGLEQAGRIRPPRALSKLGSVSYSVYLGHCLFIGLTYQVLAAAGLYRMLPEWLNYVIAVGIAVTISTLIGLRIELPLVRKLKNLRSTQRSERPGASLPT